MTEIETDYLVVGAGASGMAFVDSLIAHSGADVVMVDRHHRPGGHWNDDYPFVRLHQPSAYYGVNSRPLGNDRIDETGSNAGFYERATAAEIVDYYGRVLDEQLLASGRVRFRGLHDYLGQSGELHHLASRLTGRTTAVRARRRLVDATYLECKLPSTHSPSYAIASGVRLVTPNDLVDITDPGSGYSIIGAGKTAMDTCTWLVDNGVDAGAIRWIRPRDAWTIDRALSQPLTLMGGSVVEWLALRAEAAAAAEDAGDLLHRLEANGAFNRLDPDVEPSVYRGATLSQAERDILRRIQDVVRMGRVLRIDTDHIELDGGSIPTDRHQVHVDCSAAGIAEPPARTIFEPDRITIQRIQNAIDPFNAAIIGFVEAVRDEDVEKNRLLPPNPLSGDAIHFARNLLVSERARMVWMAESDVRDWFGASRLMPLRDAALHLTDQAGQAALVRFLQNTGPAIENLGRIVR